MAGLCRALLSSSFAVPKNFTQVTPCRTKFTKTRISPQVMEEWAKDHEKYGGDPEQPHKLHLVTRIKSTMRRPKWEKKVIETLGLQKGHQPRVHKNSHSVNNLLKIVKHLVRIEPLKLPHGLPAEEDMANTYLNSKGELIVKRLLKPPEKKVIKP
ncbi:hypothetical protein DNTS_032775 [Danionella cerebrum]|uniref:Large ribosomal subunit protein uL30m n=1 Tax=Danionella cerebrum TaxID=2873325 RepID=A0A553RA35_9TELE|nr:hypothetical protein DNTS_032775 [Danionella translucida]